MKELPEADLESVVAGRRKTAQQWHEELFGPKESLAGAYTTFPKTFPKSVKK